MCVCNRPKTAERPRGLYFQNFSASLRVYCVPSPHNPEIVVGARFRKTAELPPTDLLVYQLAPPSTFPPMTAISFHTHDVRVEPAAVSLSHTPLSNARTHYPTLMCIIATMYLSCEKQHCSYTHENASQCHTLKGQRQTKSHWLTF